MAEASDSTIEIDWALGTVPERRWRPKRQCWACQKSRIGAPPFEQFGDPALADVGVEWRHHVVDHPEDGLTGFGLPQVVTLCSVMHLFGGEFTGGDERVEAFEVVDATGVDHRHGRQQEVHLLFDGGCMPLADGFEGVAEDVVPFHRLARVRVD